MIAFDFRLIYPDGIIYFTFQQQKKLTYPLSVLVSPHQELYQSLEGAVFS